MITLYNYEDKSKELLKEKCLSELNVTEEEIFTKESETESGLFKNKKYQLTVVKKEDIISEVKDFINTLAQKFNIEINTEVTIRDNNINVMMVSNNNAILIGKDARTLNALTTIIKQAVFNQIGAYYNFVLDVSEYKEKQQFFIEKAAKKTAKEVARTKIEAKLEPMNSYERRIVHNVLTNFKGVYTESEGVEPHRYVVIKPEKEEIGETTE